VEHTRKSLGKYKRYLIQNTIKKPLKYLSVIISSLSILLKEKQKVIISFGAGPTVPIALLGKLLFGSKLIYIECSAQVYEPSLSGKILYPFSDLFFVQWRYLKEKYGDKAIYGGLLI
jgi:UDP-N-acetylglucosamine:LPS N-acetylglucosamine transferase